MKEYEHIANIIHEACNEVCSRYCKYQEIYKDESDSWLLEHRDELIGTELDSLSKWTDEDVDFYLEEGNMLDGCSDELYEKHCTGCPLNKYIFCERQ